MKKLFELGDDITVRLTVTDSAWGVFDTSYDPGPSPLLHIASTRELAEAWVAVHQHESIYPYVIQEWLVDDE